ncbi:MAG TPA: S8 family serine peptidase [Pyrinomonadaceae bacterium]|jgi:subtilisin family serine protease
MKRIFALLLAAILLCAFTLPLVHVQGQSQHADKFRKVQKPIVGEYIVVLNDETPGSQVGPTAKGLIRPHGGIIKFLYESSLKGFSARLTEAAAVAISQSPLVQYVEENGEAHVTDTQFNPPNWGLDRIDQNYGLDQTYTYNRTGAGVVAYVLDSGIDANHPDFGGRASLVADYIGDGCGDCNGHGTAAAGIIGSNTYGVAKGVTLRAVKVCNSQGSCPTDTVIAGVNFVSQQKDASPYIPMVANMSLGGGGSTSMDSAVRNSIKRGVTYVVAAGNGNTYANNVSPARVTEAITVGAVDINDTRAVFNIYEASNFGSVLDLFAPGKDTPSTFPGGGQVNFGGTSAAAPHVAGVVAQYLQSEPGAAPVLTSYVITTNATPGVVIDPGPSSPNRLLFSAFAMREPPPADSVPFHRFQSNGYFYTTVFSQGASWSYNGIQCYVLTNQTRPGTIPLYRFQNPRDGRFFYTTDYNEGAYGLRWTYQGPAAVVFADGSTPGTVPLYRFRGNSGYFYTTNYYEGANAGMIYEGVQCYVFP